MSLPSWECGLKSFMSNQLLFVNKPSLPSWECGLKYKKANALFMDTYVAPFVGVWIEITYSEKLFRKYPVAPFVGVWIEICWVMSSMNIIYVAPFVGVWIEMHLHKLMLQPPQGRSLRGSVD